MRVQRQGQSLRLRIDEAELQQLLDGAAVLNETHWPDGGLGCQRVILGSVLSWQRESGGWCLTLPAAEVQALAARLPTRDGLSWPLPVARAEPLQLHFDVDVRDSARKRRA